MTPFGSGSTITNLESDGWLQSVRRSNQVPNFKAASAVLLRESETIYNRKILGTPELRRDETRTFQADRLSKINRLLTNVSLVMGQRDFEFRSMDDLKLEPEALSSGESETVALATEILYFFDTASSDKFNVLLLDEPDVHLHPDLQARLAHLIVGMLDEYASNEAFEGRIAICLATHSAPLVCAIASSPHACLGTKSYEVSDVILTPATEQFRKVAPFFGHPLSLALSADVALIVEGEDDERVWQQAARSSQGRIRLFPVLATSVDQQSELEKFAGQLLATLYDSPIAFSIRDGDGKTQALDHTPPVRRYRLGCYAIENLLLTDDCLAQMNCTWDSFRERGTEWLRLNGGHQSHKSLEALLASSDRQRHTKIKDIRNLICGICGTTKPWEVVVGQSIGAVAPDAGSAPGSLLDYFGEEAFRALVPKA